MPSTPLQAVAEPTSAALAASSFPLETPSPPRASSSRRPRRLQPSPLDALAAIAEEDVFEVNSDPPATEGNGGC